MCHCVSRTQPKQACYGPATCVVGPCVLLAAPASCGFRNPARRSRNPAVSATLLAAPCRPLVPATRGLRSRMRLFVTPPQSVHRDMGVDLCGRQGAVAQNLLDGPQVRSAVQQMGGGTVPQRVRPGGRGVAQLSEKPGRYGPDLPRGSTRLPRCPGTAAGPLWSRRQSGRPRRSQSSIATAAG